MSVLKFPTSPVKGVKCKPHIIQTFCHSLGVIHYKKQKSPTNAYSDLPTISYCTVITLLKLRLTGTQFPQFNIDF